MTYDRIRMWQVESAEVVKALSIRQPWAFLIMHSGKDVENRTWPTRFRGELLVHAGLKHDRADFRDYLDDIAHAPKDANGQWPMHIGKLLGVVTLIDCVRTDALRSKWAIGGNWGFVLANPRPFARPIKFKGALGFFEVPDDVVKAAFTDASSVFVA